MCVCACDVISGCAFCTVQTRDCGTEQKLDGHSSLPDSTFLRRTPRRLLGFSFGYKRGEGRGGGRIGNVAVVRLFFSSPQQCINKQPHALKRTPGVGLLTATGGGRGIHWKAFAPSLFYRQAHTHTHAYGFDVSDVWCCCGDAENYSP